MVPKIRFSSNISVKNIYFENRKNHDLVGKYQVSNIQSLPKASRYHIRSGPLNNASRTPYRNDSKKNPVYLQIGRINKYRICFHCFVQEKLRLETRRAFELWDAYRHAETN